MTDVFQVGFSDEHINGYGDVPYTQVTIEPIKKNATLSQEQKELVREWAILCELANHYPVTQSDLDRVQEIIKELGLND